MRKRLVVDATYVPFQHLLPLSRTKGKKERLKIIFPILYKKKHGAKPSNEVIELLVYLEHARSTALEIHVKVPRLLRNKLLNECIEDYTFPGSKRKPSLEY
jgi:hypothetical protein